MQSLMMARTGHNPSAHHGRLTDGKLLSTVFALSNDLRLGSRASIGHDGKHVRSTPKSRRQGED